MVDYAPDSLTSGVSAKRTIWDLARQGVQACRPRNRRPDPQACQAEATLAQAKEQFQVCQLAHCVCS